MRCVQGGSTRAPSNARRSLAHGGGRNARGLGHARETVAARREERCSGRSGGMDGWQRSTAVPFSLVPLCTPGEVWRTVRRQQCSARPERAPVAAHGDILHQATSELPQQPALRTQRCAAASRLHIRQPSGHTAHPKNGQTACHGATAEAPSVRRELGIPNHASAVRASAIAGAARYCAECATGGAAVHHAGLCRNVSRYVAACCTMLQPDLPATTAGVRERSAHARIGRPGQVHLRLQLPRRATAG